MQHLSTWALGQIHANQSVMTKIIRANFLSFNFRVSIIPLPIFNKIYMYNHTAYGTQAFDVAHIVSIHFLVCCFFSVSRVQLSRGSHVCFKQINLSKRNTFAANNQRQQ